MGFEHTLVRMDKM